MHSRNFKKKVQAFVASVLSLSLIIGIPFDLGSTLIVQAATDAPDVTVYASKAELMGDTFAPIGGTGENIGKVYFGTCEGEPISWYVLGKDSGVTGDNTMLFATKNLADSRQYNDNPSGAWPEQNYTEGCGVYEGPAPATVYFNHYGASEFRRWVNGTFMGSIFTEAELGMLNASEVSIPDEKNGVNYKVSDKLYCLGKDSDTNNHITIGTGDVKLNLEFYVSGTLSSNVRTFLLRTPSTGNNQGWTAVYNYSLSDYLTMTEILYSGRFRPATNLDLSDVLFASVVKEESGSGSFASDATMTLRLDGNNRNIGSVAYTADTITVEKGSADSTVSLVVQGKSDSRNWYYSQEITEDTTISEDDIESSNNSFSVDGLSNCKIWLETTIDGMKYAVLAEPASEQPEEEEQTDTVSAPTATPGSGEYEENQRVTLSTDTEGATIYYTTDGSTPTEESTGYEDTIEIAGSPGEEVTTTIKAIAVKDGMEDSTVASFEYTIRIAGEEDPEVEDPEEEDPEEEDPEVEDPEEEEPAVEEPKAEEPEEEEPKAEEPMETEEQIFTRELLESIVNVQAGDNKGVDATVWHSFSSNVLKELLAKEGVSYTLYFNYGGECFYITIPAGAVLEEGCEWYGPLKLNAMFGRTMIDKSELYEALNK